MDFIPLIIGSFFVDDNPEKVEMRRRKTFFLGLPLFRKEGRGEI
jgi:hypothetical protein